MSSVASLPARHKFLPIPLRTLCVSTALPVDLYLRAHKDATPVLYRARHIDVPDGELAKLLESGVETVFIPREQAEDYQQHLRGNVNTIVADDSLPLEQRLQFLGDTGRSILCEVFKADNLDRTMEAVSEISDHMVKLMWQNEVMVGELFDLLRHDYRTYTHSYNVASYAMLLAKGLGVSDEQELKAISLGGLLHDLGKLRIPSLLLNKKSRLTEDERATIKRHPTDGFTALASRQEMSYGQLMMVYQHHEKLDGSGYPVGVGGNEIHHYARICSVVDVFEALTSNRSYRNSAKSAEAVAFLEQQGEQKLDREMVQCWKALLKQAPPRIV